MQRLMKWYRIWSHKCRHKQTPGYPVAYCEQCGRVSHPYFLCLKCNAKKYPES
jgi:hypothetical protein